MDKPHKSIRVFKNPILERLTHVHPITPLVIWVPCVIALIWRSFEVHSLPALDIAAYGFLGLVSWTFIEYVLHRFVFHFDGGGALGQRFHFLIHGLHHDDPSDPSRLVMPPAASIILAAILFNLFRALLGDALVEPFFAFFLVGYLCYDYIHFGVHHFACQSRILRFLKQSHMQHHYVSPNARWGVSSPFWDYVFGTLESQKKQRTI